MRAKKAAGGQDGNTNAAKNEVDKMSTSKTAEKLAKEHGVTEKTVRNRCCLGWTTNSKRRATGSVGLKSVIKMIRLQELRSVLPRNTALQRRLLVRFFRHRKPLRTRCPRGFFCVHVHLVFQR